MGPEIIAIICVAVAVVLLAILIFVFLHKKNKKGTESEQILENRQTVATNAQTVEILLVLAKGKENTVKELLKLQDELRYLTPSTDEKVKQIDEKIANELGDCKIELSKKHEENEDGKLAMHLENIRLKIAERSVLTDKH